MVPAAAAPIPRSFSEALPTSSHTPIPRVDYSEEFEETDQTAIEQVGSNVQMWPAPISPEKAPRILRIMPSNTIPKLNRFGVPTDPTTLNHSVRRVLFTESAKWRYLALYQRDLEMSDIQPEQSDEYLQRAADYHEQLSTCKETSRVAKRKIRHLLKGDVVQNPNTACSPTPLKGTQNT